MKGFVLTLCLMLSLPGWSQPMANGPCAQDVKTLCAGIEPGQGRIKQCLKSKKDQVSQACKDRFKSKIKLAKVNCQQDIENLCAGIKPGQGRIARCLRSNKASLSAQCRSTFPRMQ